MSEIMDLLEKTRGKEKRNLEGLELYELLEKVKALIRKKAIVGFNRSSENVFEVGAFEIFLNQKKPIFKMQLNSLFFRANGRRVCIGCVTEVALDKLEKEIEELIKEVMQTEIKVSVKHTFHSK